jgi:hypothetical protein
VKREAEVARGVDGDTDEDAGATRGADGGVGAARGATGAAVFEVPAIEEG